MLSKMFKGQNPFEDENPGVRKEALEQLDIKDPEAVAIIVHLINTDPDANVRKAAVNLCPDFNLIANLLMDAEFESLAQKRILAEVVDLVDLAVSHPKLDVRKKLATFVQSDEQLTLLEKRSRDHDKTLNRYARDTLQKRIDSQSKISQAHLQGEDLIDRLENHVKLQHTSSWAAKAQALTRQWEELLPNLADPQTLLARYQTIVKKIEQANLPSEFLSLIDQAGQIEQQWQSTWPIVEGTFETWQKDWLAKSKAHVTTASESELFVRLSDRFQKIRHLIDTTTQLKEMPEIETEPPHQTPQSPKEFQSLWKHQQKLKTSLNSLRSSTAKIHWPDWLADSPEIEQAEQRITLLSKSIAATSTTQDSLLSIFTDTKKQLEETLSLGKSESVAPILSKCRELLKQLPKAVADKGRDQIDILGAKFDELRDWKTYATEPKREAYCLEMELLINSDTPIPERAQAIKDLRNRWNQLGQVRGQPEYKFQKRFNDAANKAFEPCKEHFDLLAQSRTDNLENRKGMLEQLEGYLATTDWPSTDIKAAEKILRSVRKEWGQYHPVPRGQIKPLEKKLDELMDKLHSNIKQVWQKNIDQKQAIVASAKEMLAETDTQTIISKIDALKNLQKQWQSIGATPRGPDQKLWRSFRKVCDEIFGLRDQERVDQNKEYDELRNKALSVIKELHAAVDASPETLSREQLNKYKVEFKELNPPNNLLAKFSRAELEYTKNLKQSAQRKIQQGTQELKTQDELVHAWECNNDHQKPENLPDCFSARLASTAPSSSVESLHKLVINAELLAGIASPDEDANLRMAVQVEHLKSGLGKRQQVTQKPTQIAQQWCESAHSKDNISALRERLFAAIDQMYKI